MVKAKRSYQIGECEAQLCAQNVDTIIGIDEAGRGPLAGPVVVAAVCLGKAKIVGLNDSKRLTERKREALFPIIQEQATAWSIVEVGLDEIDTLNILHATMAGMRRATEAVVQELGVQKGIAIFDGNRVPSWPQGTQPIATMPLVKGDQRSLNVAAASILAKVHRDRLMIALDSQYPGYGLAKHKGYPTAAHKAAIAELGPTPIHRRGFAGVKEHLIEQPEAASKKALRGRDAEELAWEHYRSQGWELLAKNWRCAMGELDLIVKRGDMVAFVEVRSRKSAGFIKPEASVNRTKQQRLSKAASAWLASGASQGESSYRFDVVSITLNNPPLVELFENAFEARGLFF